MKKILLIVLSMMLAFTPAFTMELADNDGIETNVSTVSIEVNGNTVRVSGTNGEDIQIFNLTGTRITTM